MALEVARGLYFVHESGVFYRGVKSPNVLITADYHAKLCDFGEATVPVTTKQGRQEFSQISIRWLAPEMMELGAQYTKACDVYSFGILLYEFSSRKVEPFCTSVARICNVLFGRFHMTMLGTT